MTKRENSTSSTETKSAVKTNKDQASAVDQESPSFRDRQRELKTSYRENPTLAKQVSAVTSVTPSDAETGKVRIAIENQAGVQLDIGAHHSVAGTEDIGCSGDYFLASLAACYEITLRLVAVASKITINRLTLRVEGDWDARGTLGLDPDVAVGFTDIRIAVELEAEGPEDRLAQLGELTERYCVVSQTLKNPPRIEVSFT